MYVWVTRITYRRAAVGAGTRSGCYKRERRGEQDKTIMETQHNIADATCQTQQAVDTCPFGSTAKTF